jgi:hypothetical protein
MNLSLDFSNARETACHCYTGVRAKIDTGEERLITITPEGCRSGVMDGNTTPCEMPVVDRVQAWAIVLFLTGSQRISPAGDAFWDHAARRMDFPLKSGARRPITD